MFPVHLIFRLLFFTVQVDSSSSMMVTWGKPSNYSAVKTYVTESWRSCLTYCYNLKSCVLVSSTVEPISCQVFSTSEILTVKKLSSSSSDMVAFKIDNSQTTCPVSSNAPTSMNFTAQGSSSTTTTNYTHSITFNGDQWTISYQQIIPTTTAKLTTKAVATTTPSPCDSGWAYFKRPAANWCMKVIAYTTTTFTHDQATLLCSKNSAVLSGLETQAERTYVANTGVTILGADYPNWAALWISGERKTECAASNWPSVTNCKSSTAQFTYSDQYLTNYGGLTWDETQPDRNNSGVWQNCMCIWLRLPGAVTTNFVNGAADDIQCGLAKTQWYALRGAVCGKLANGASG